MNRVILRQFRNLLSSVTQRGELGPGETMRTESLIIGDGMIRGQREEN